MVRISFCVALLVYCNGLLGMEWLAHFGCMRMRPQTEKFFSQDPFDKTYEDIRTLIFSFLIKTDADRYEDIIASLQMYKKLITVCKVFKGTAEKFKQKVMAKHALMKTTNEWFDHTCDHGHVEKKFTQLHYATIDRDLNAMKQLLDKGANPDKKDAYDATPLYWLIHASYHCPSCGGVHCSIPSQDKESLKKTLELLFMYNADPTILDTYPNKDWEKLNTTPLKQVQFVQDTEIVTILEKAIQKKENGSRSKPAGYFRCSIQ